MTDDLDRLMDVMAASFDPAYGEAWNRRQVGDALSLPNTHYLLAGPTGDTPADDEPATGFVLSRGAAGEEELLLIAVHPGFRRRGIGVKLMQRLFLEASARGTQRIFLEMREGNPAEQLYLKVGFQPVGRRRGYYRAARFGPLDAVTFAYELQSGLK